MSIKIKKFRREQIRGKFALATEPPISRRLFDEIERILGDQSPIAPKLPLLNSSGLEFANGCLLLSSPKLDGHLKTNIQGLLDLAEQRVAEREKAAAQKASTAQFKQNESIRAAADGFGIPLE